MSVRRLLLSSIVVLLPLITAACGAPLAVTAVSYGADGVSLVATQKSVTDHLASMVSKKDCALWRMFRSRPICKDREDGHDPYNVDYDTPERTASEGGVQYLAPAHAADNAPATSWDLAAYSKPAPPVPAAEPMTAVAEAAPPTADTAAPPAPTAAAKPLPPHPRKKGRSVKAKPAKLKALSPGQAASRL